MITLGIGSANVRRATAADDASYGTTLAALYVDPSSDAGIWIPLAIGDLVWNDVSHDGIQQSDESGLPGFTVALLDGRGQPAVDATGVQVPAVTTNTAGHYQFDNLTAGDYQLRFTAPAGSGYVPTAPTARGSTAATDSDTGTVGLTAVFTLAASGGNTRLVTPSDGASLANGIDPTIDAGYWKVPVEPVVIVLMALGDHVWFDANHDGIQSDAEVPVAGMTVELLTADGSPAKNAKAETVGAVTTAADGRYVFDNLLPGTYRVRFGNVPSGYAFTLTGRGSLTADSDADPQTGLSNVFELVPSGANVRPVTAPDGAALAGFIDPTLDAGIWQPLAVGNFIWFDANKNGIQDNGEQPVGGAKLELLNADGTPAVDAYGIAVAPIITAADGKYLFDNLAPGSYRIRITPPFGFTLTAQTAQGSAAANDSDVAADGLTPEFVLSVTSPRAQSGSVQDGTMHIVDVTVDAGLVRTDSPSLPITGATIAPILLLALALFVTGVAIVAIRRRRPV